MQLSRYLRIFPDAGIPGSHLVYSTRRSSLARVSDSLLAAMRSGNLDPARSERLARIGILTPDPEAEVAEMRQVLRGAADRTRKFNVTAVLNLDCNLACPYCYEDRFRRSQYMSPETASLLLERLLLPQIALGRDLHVDFYGGEPLLSLALLKEIADKAASAAATRGVAFAFDLFSNCTLLTRRKVEDLLPLGLKGVRMTLDGPKEIHDRQRPFVSGKGSFDTIVANLKEIHDLVAVQLTGNYGAGNWREFPRLLDHLLAEGITPAMVDLVHFGPIMPKAGEGASPHHGGHCACGTEPWLMEAAVTLREETLKRGFPSRKVAMAACVVDFDNEFIVNYDGAIYKCPMFMGYPELAVGTLLDGIGDYGASHGLDRWQNEECLACPYLPLCFGGCRFFPLQREGEISGIDCRREFYDATLEEFVLQEQRYLSKKSNCHREHGETQRKSN
jgi:uncharacterized protein